MKLNWKVRFKNKVWLGLFLSLIVGFIFNLLKLCEIYPPFTENTVMNIVNQVLTFLGLIGVLVDPTTDGVKDSDRAMGYDVPWNDADPQNMEEV